MVASVKAPLRPKPARDRELPAARKARDEAGAGRRKAVAATPMYAATFILEGGQVSIRLAASGEAVKGDLIQLYAGDSLIGTGAIEEAPRGAGLICHVAVDQAPQLSFPAAIRALLPRLNVEIAPGLNVASLREFQAKMGRHGLELQLAQVQDRAIRFDVTVACLAAFPRMLTLNLGGRAPVKAVSEVPAHSGTAPTLTHSVVFPIQAAVRDGMAIEVMDDATGSTVFETTMTWMNLINPVLAELRSMQEQQAALTARLEAMRNQIMSSVDPGRERLLLQRLDLTYLLLNERMDRELKWLSSRIDAAEGDKLALEHLAAPRPTLTQLSASALQGVGMHDVETNGVSHWRWFSRTVTLFLTDVDTEARHIRFNFTSSSPVLDLTRMTVLVNGYDAPFEWLSPESGVELVINLSRIAVRPDRTLILTIDFGHGWSAENDARVLTLACTGLKIES